VRIVHWLLVLAVTGSWITSKFSASLFRWHEYCGYTVLVLVGFRLVWGLVGTHYARFRQFVRGPRAVVRYIARLRSRSDAPLSVGHNPLGGWSVVLMLVLLLSQAGTGLFANDDVSNVGPFFGWVSSSLSNRLTSYHHRIFTALQVLIALHLAAVAFYLVIRRENLVLPMLTGRKPFAAASVEEPVSGSRLWLACAIAALLAAALALAIRLAPDATLSIF
jgi:cytochrome b